MKKKTIKRLNKKRTLRKSRRCRKKLTGGRNIHKINGMQPIPLPKVPQHIEPAKTINTRINLKGGFKADIVDNIEDRDDDWIITKQ